MIYKKVSKIPNYQYFTYIIDIKEIELGFKIPRRSRCAGSSPARGTIKNNGLQAYACEPFFFW